MNSKYPSRTDIVTAMSNPHVSFKSEELLGGSIIRKGSRAIQYSGGYSTVFPFNTKDDEKIAVRLWIADIGDAKKRSLEISNYLEFLNSNYFARFRYLDEAILINGILHPVVVMKWVNGKTLKDYIQDNIRDSGKIRNLASKFKSMVEYFHEENISHGDLQHGNILVKDDGEIVVIDYDSMYIEPLEGMPDVIKGLMGYQHPQRKNNLKLNKSLDYFSELIIYLSLLVYSNDPLLWTKYYGTEDLLFSKEDLNEPNSSELIANLILSEDEMISLLANKLKEELSKDDILDLCPLEELLINKLEESRDNIFDKWGRQPNPPSKKELTLPDKKNITDKF
jgi:serine/threonine protein kinase